MADKSKILERLVDAYGDDELKRIFSPHRKSFESHEVAFLAETIYGRFLAEWARKESESMMLREKLDTFSQEHSESISLLFENEAQKYKLELLNEKLAQANSLAYKAGMADVSTDILHNVGNILNNIGVSIYVIEKNLKHTIRKSGLKEAGKLLGENLSDIQQFVSQDKRANPLMRYLSEVGEKVIGSQQEMLQHVQRISEKISNVTQVVNALHSYANRTEGVVDESRLTKIIDDALIISSATLNELSIEIEKHYPQKEVVALVQETKVLQSLTNIFANAAEAMRTVSPNQRRLSLFLTQNTQEGYARLSIQDSGVGITEEHLKQIFTHGFTTKDTGAGFGLHNCANYIKEMGGEIWARSDGPGKGATFVLQLPLSSVEDQVTF